MACHDKHVCNAVCVSLLTALQAQAHAFGMHCDCHRGILLHAQWMTRVHVSRTASLLIQNSSPRSPMYSWVAFWLTDMFSHPSGTS